MYTLLILAVLTSTALTGISLSATHPALRPDTGSPVNSSRGDTAMDHHNHQPRSDDREPAQRALRRRSINIPDPDKPKINRLLKVNRNRFLEVTQDGQVVTATSSSSLYSKLEVQFMCQLFPEQFRPCSPWLADHRRLPEEGERDDEDQRSTYSAVLLRFTQTNRYLCIDESANIYTRPNDSTDRGSLDISECVFQHDLLPNQYDVYSSHKYPRNTSRCLHRASPDRPRRGGAAKGRYCDKRWFIGVNRKSEVLTVKSSRAPNQKAFFIQRWVHDQPSQTSPQFNVNPHREAKRLRNNTNSSSNSSISTTTKRPEVDSSPRRPAKNRTSLPVSIRSHPRVMSRRPVYRFLTRPSSSLFGQRNRGKGAHKKSGCGNLLRNCDDDADDDANGEEEREWEDEERQEKLFTHRSGKRRREHKRRKVTT